MSNNIHNEIYGAEILYNLDRWSNQHYCNIHNDLKTINSYVVFLPFSTYAQTHWYQGFGVNDYGIVVCFNRGLSCSLFYLDVHFRQSKMTIFLFHRIFTLSALYFCIGAYSTKIRISTALIKTFFLKYRLRSNYSGICY